ncbi:MAG: radical SAM protein, partial [Candidatus Promineifilaceae bacterium]|nr:radical SAM protein [Candidatus Promineifilaceae bacterium]
ARIVARQFQVSAQQPLEDDLRLIYSLIRSFRDPVDGCATCAIEDLGRSALFSMPANAPYKADLALTYGCNNHCAHCYNEPDRFDMPSLPTEQWFAVLDRLHEVGVPHVILTGGEATLHPDLPAIIHHADRLGMVVGLNSNGRRLAHEPYARMLADAGLNHTQITLASSRPTVHNAVMNANAFQQTVRGIQTAMAAGIHTITNTTLMRSNCHHVIEIIDFLHDLGIRTFAMNGMIYSGGGRRDPNAIAESQMAPLLIQIRDHAAERGMRFLWYTPTEYCRLSPVELELGAKRCNAGEYSICIEPNGDVLPCQSFYTGAGNILRDEWSSIWHGTLFRSFRDREKDPRLAGLPEKCWDCPDLPLCGGGCRIEREAQFGPGQVGACAQGCGHSVGAVQSPGFLAAPTARRSTTRSTGGAHALVECNTIDIAMVHPQLEE